MTTVTSLTEQFVWVLVKSSEITSEYIYIWVCVFFLVCVCVCEYAGIPAHVNCLWKKSAGQTSPDSVGPWLPTVARQQQSWQQVEAWSSVAKPEERIGWNFMSTTEIQMGTNIKDVPHGARTLKGCFTAGEMVFLTELGCDCCRERMEWIHWCYTTRGNREKGTLIFTFAQKEEKNRIT